MSNITVQDRNTMSPINNGMRQLIRIVNRLQDVYSRLGIQLSLDLPQIAVVGGQSAGKSSVLENFVGRDFLPRGTGIVTRRPLILQLINSNEEYAEFLHKPNEKFYDFNKVQKEIENETIRISGRKKGISNVPINLKAFSPNVLNLTLIDLPGMTKIAIDDQPQDIDIQIRNMILEYITKPSCLILAVTPANVDIATSDALQIAREVDQQGLRTIGVLTKLDLMDKGTDARDILENKVFPLKRGYVGVVNRSQRALDARKDIQSQINEERKFFLEHSAYKHMANRMGTLYLQQTLNQQLTEHIKTCLPGVKQTLKKQLLQLDKELEDYNQDENESSTKAKRLLKLIQNFTMEFEQSLEGSRPSEIDTDELSGGARIHSIFHRQFPKELAKIQLNEIELRKEISIAICNIHGIRIGLFTPDLAFDTVMKKQIIKLKQPCINCIDLVCKELLNIINTSIENKMSYYPNLKQAVQEILSNQIDIFQQRCNDQVALYIHFQLSYMNTNHDDFVGFSTSKELQHGDNKIIKRLTNHASNIIIKKGYVQISNSSFMKGDKMFWFELTSEKLSWYRDNTEKEFLNSITFDGIQLRESESKSFMSKKSGFSLVNVHGKSIYKDSKQLDLRFNSSEEEESWKEALLRAGIFQDGEVKFYTTEDTASNIVNDDDNDSQLKKQVETIRHLVDSYRHIVNKSTKDLLPKMITHIILNAMNKYIHSDLVIEMYNVERSQDDLLEESTEEKSKREEKIKAHKACKAALDIISECYQIVNYNTKMDDDRSGINSLPNSKPQNASFSTHAGRVAPRPPPPPKPPKPPKPTKI